MSLKRYILNHKTLSKIAWCLINNKNVLIQRVQNANELMKLKDLKNSNKCKRCFIIGTGPSLKIEDLEALKNEIVFAPNRIYELFEKTDWRPTYYLSQDHKLIQNFIDKIKTVEAEKIFLPIEFKNEFIGDKYNFFVLKEKNYYPKSAPFSKDISKYLAQGFTVTYGAIQIAAYMGFTEIYLLGIDHNYNIIRDAKGNVVRDKNAVNYADGIKDFKGNLPRIEETTIAYETAEKLSKKLGIKIYNCTRGGKLEAFERRNLEDVLN